MANHHTGGHHSRGFGMRGKKVLASVALATTGVLGTAGQAAAVQWGPITSTLGSSNGTYFNEGSIYARTNVNYKDNRAGGAPVYHQTWYQYYVTTCGASGCVSKYTIGATRQTSRTSSGSWAYGWTHYGLDSSSDKARGMQEVCQDEAYTRDPCSDAKAYPSFTY
jgi:hypothetical protein